MRKTFMCGAMKLVSLLFDQPTYLMIFDDNLKKDNFCQVSIKTYVVGAH